MWKGPHFKQIAAYILNVDDSLLIDPIISQECVTFLLYPVIHTVMLHDRQGLFAHYSSNTKTSIKYAKSRLK